MKKVFNISFALVYLFLTTGFTITIHYCGGIVSDVSIVRTYGDKDPCGCESPCEFSCCKDNIHNIKVSDSHKSEAKFNQNIIAYVVKVVSFESSNDNDYNKIEFFANHLGCNSGPPNVYLYNCSFLI